MQTPLNPASPTNYRPSHHPRPTPPQHLLYPTLPHFVSSLAAHRTNAARLTSPPTSPLSLPSTKQLPRVIRVIPIRLLQQPQQLHVEQHAALRGRVAAAAATRTAPRDTDHAVLGRLVHAGFRLDVEGKLLEVVDQLRLDGADGVVGVAVVGGAGEGFLGVGVGEEGEVGGAGEEEEDGGEKFHCLRRVWGLGKGSYRSTWRGAEFV